MLGCKREALCLRSADINAGGKSLFDFVCCKDLFICYRGNSHTNDVILAQLQWTVRCHAAGGPASLTVSSKSHKEYMASLTVASSYFHIKLFWVRGHSGIVG